MKAILLLIFWYSLIIGCDNEMKDKVKITIKSKSQLKEKIVVSRDINLDQDTLIEAKTDSLGNSSFDVSLQKPIFATIQIGRKYGEVYLSPGYDLVIEEVGEQYQTPLKFSGKGANVNSYIGWVNSNIEKIKWANGKGLNQLNESEFLSRFDSIKGIINNFHISYIDSVDLPKDLVSKLEYKNRIKFLSIVQEFKFYNYSNAINEQWQAQRNEGNYIKKKFSNEIKDLTNEVPFDTILLKDGFNDYQVLLNFYWQNNINLRISEELSEAKDSIHLAPLMTNSLIKQGSYPEPIREFFLAFNFRFWLGALGITPETDAVFRDFKNTYRNSSYLAVLNRGYDEWLTVAPGKPIPEFEGNTRDGKKMSINDFKGKIVYIDIWATWCAPCIAEIPASKKLQQEFSKEEYVQFLNISVDMNRSNWEKFIDGDRLWKGLHLIIAQDRIQSFYANNKLFGIPAFILIDQSGNIVNMKAPRPSDEKIKIDIRRLLTEAKVTKKINE